MPKDNNRRTMRIARLIKELLGSLLITEIRDERLKWVIVTDVEITKDYKNAKVFFSMMQDDLDPKIIIMALERATAFFQKQIASRLNFKNTPFLSYKYDDTSVKGARVNQLLASTVAKRRDSLEEETNENKLMRLILDSKSILITGHQNPDGDSLGSILAMNRFLGQKGKKPVLYCGENIPLHFSFLPGFNDIKKTLPSDFSCDLTIVLDTASFGQLPPLPSLERLGEIAVIDHHNIFEDFASFSIRRKASSTGEILFDLANELLFVIDNQTATCLFVAIMTDTGSFKYSNTSPKVLRDAAQLLDKGVEVDFVARQIYSAYSLSRQLLMGKVASSIKIELEGKIAFCSCTRQMMDDCHALDIELEGMVDLCSRIKDVEAALFFSETPDQKIKVSFRSNSDFNIAQVASQFGGGGHIAAAGALIDRGSMEDVISLVLKETKNALKKHWG